MLSKFRLKRHLAVVENGTSLFFQIEYNQKEDK